jgi:hypothetical protein
VIFIFEFFFLIFHLIQFNELQKYNLNDEREEEIKKCSINLLLSINKSNTKKCVAFFEKERKKKKLKKKRREKNVKNDGNVGKSMLLSNSKRFNYNLAIKVKSDSDRRITIE